MDFNWEEDERSENYIVCDCGWEGGREDADRTESEVDDDLVEIKRLCPSCGNLFMVTYDG